eukprot:Rhum_TRINITY_DN9008_c0_g1::Rhum_TRINITY_DN9008_c0_g1_i1::g.31438::m.31438
MAYWLWPGDVKYDSDEQKMRTYSLTLDAVAVPTLTGVYLGVAHLLRKHGDGGGGLIHTPGDEATGILNAAVAAMAAYHHIYVTPAAMKSSPVMYGVQSVLGRWIYLTRQVIVFQAIHCFLGLFMPEVANVMSVIISGLGIFVTIQYFTLVHFNQVFRDECKVWESKGVPFRDMMAVLHVPAGALGLIDVLFTRSRPALQASTPDGHVLAGLIATYTVLYTLLLHWNFAKTGYWPYPVLDPLGRCWKKWSKFISVQTTILSSFIGFSHYAAVFAPLLR